MKLYDAHDEEIPLYRLGFVPCLPRRVRAILHDCHLADAESTKTVEPRDDENEIGKTGDLLS